ncbi:MAG: alpha/beta hydrolase [Herminiimonas sp.]|nr:alpha/beta hydrolase [Herminiimonas sp.]
MIASAKVTLSLTAIAIVLGTLVACSPLRAINAVTPASSYDQHAALSYGADARNKLDVYTPRNAGASLPVVVFFYGGSWNRGARADYEFVGEALASRGIVAVLADYRLYPQVHYPEILDDSAHAVAWTAKEIQRYGGDPKRIFVMGHSSGAYNAAMVALDDRLLAKYALTPSTLRGLIGLAGPYDFIPIENPDVRPVFFFPNTPPDSQPINHVSTTAPPALLIASNKDDLVNPVRNTSGLSKKLRAAGVGVKEVYFDNTSHASLVATLSRPLRGLAKTLDIIEEFVKSDGGRTAATSVAK